MKTFVLALLCALWVSSLAQTPPFNPQGRPNRNQPGPWNNDVLVYRVGSDGEVEEISTFERAGVPTAARLKDGRLVVAHQHFPEDNDADFDKVAVHFSSDEGRSWTAPQVIRVSGLPAGMRFPFDPTLVPLPDGRVRLYFTSVKGRTFRDNRPAIYSAISCNAVDYVVEPGVRFGLEGRPVIDCAVVLHQGVFHLFVPDNGAGGPPSGAAPRQRAAPVPPNPRLRADREPAALPQAAATPVQRPRDGAGYHATSPDGLTFTREPDVHLEGRRRWLGNAQSDGTVLRFFGTGEGVPGKPGGVWSATSTDGRLWKLDEDFASVPGADPGAVKLKDNGWLIVVTGPPRPGTPGPQTRRAGAPPGVPPQEAQGPRPPIERTRRPFAVPRDSFGAEFEDVFIRIPSTAAGKEGVAGSLLIPRQPRFTNGAPVVINVSGGVQAGNARGRPEYVGHGFLEIHFAFPGGGAGEKRSGGMYDFRGPKCIRALADVIRFATGRIADQNGRPIRELVRGVKVLTNNVGIVGSSHGGNACGMTMALHGEEFPELAWYASMESPYGEGAANVELGGHESGLNPAYEPKTGKLGLSKLAWSGELSPGLFRKPMLVNTRELKGALFFDLDGNGRFTGAEDFPANCFVGDAGDGVRAWYSPRLLAEVDRRGLMRDERPRHVPTLAEAKEFWRYRDAAPSIPDAVRTSPNVAVIVYANERDHVQADPAHTHILEQVEAFRKAGARFVRLNPDRAYVEAVVPPGSRFEQNQVFADNPAGSVWSRANIAEGLEPTALPLGLYMQATVCELADRTQAGNWSANLDTVLFPNAPKPPLLLPPAGGPQSTPRPGPDAKRPAFDGPGGPRNTD